MRYSTEELFFEKPNGQKIAVKVFRPSEEEKQYPTVIFSHGFGANYRALEHHGHGFSENGIVCIFFDFCGGGMDSFSDGSMLEMTVLTEVDDLKFMMDEVQKLPYVDGDNLFLIGESMGGFVSAYVAAEVSKLTKGLILWYPAFIIPDDAKMRFEEGLNVALGMRLSPDFSKVAKDIDIFSMIAAYKAPVRIIHGDHDPIVPISYSQRAIEVYENAELTVIEGAAHGFDGDDSEYAREISIDFIKTLG